MILSYFYFILLWKGLEPLPQNLQFCALPVVLPKLYLYFFGEIGNRTLTFVMQTRNTNHYIISPVIIKILYVYLYYRNLNNIIVLSIKILIPLLLQRYLVKMCYL